MRTQYTNDNGNFIGNPNFPSDGNFDGNPNVASATEHTDFHNRVAEAINNVKVSVTSMNETITGLQISNGPISVQDQVLLSALQKRGLLAIKELEAIRVEARKWRSVWNNSGGGYGYGYGYGRGGQVNPVGSLVGSAGPGYPTAPSPQVL